MLYLQGDPGPMVPKGNTYKHVTEKIAERNASDQLMFGLADLKSPKVKKWPKKDHDYTDEKNVSNFFFMILFFIYKHNMF